MSLAVIQSAPKVIAASMPSGVEHADAIIAHITGFAVIAASMPSGVEHIKEGELPHGIRQVIAASMPSGVEHRCKCSTAAASRGDRRIDAFGR